jgi:hypothetical protein
MIRWTVTALFLSFLFGSLGRAQPASIANGWRGNGTGLYIMTDAQLFAISDKEEAPGVKPGAFCGPRCVRRSDTSTAIWFSVLRASVGSTEGRRSICATGCGPTRRRGFSNGMAASAPTFEATPRTQRAWLGVRRAMLPTGKEAGRLLVADEDVGSRKRGQAR